MVGIGPQRDLGHAEELGQPPPVRFFQLARRTLAHELLQIAGIAAEHGGKRGEAGASGLGQFDQLRAVRRHRFTHKTVSSSPPSSDPRHAGRWMREISHSIGFFLDK